MSPLCFLTKGPETVANINNCLVQAPVICYASAKLTTSIHTFLQLFSEVPQLCPGSVVTTRNHSGEESSVVCIANDRTTLPVCHSQRRPSALACPQLLMVSLTCPRGVLLPFCSLLYLYLFSFQFCSTVDNTTASCIPGRIYSQVTFAGARPLELQSSPRFAFSSVAGSH